MKLFDLSERVVVVTGGGRGLGRAMATGLAEAGAMVVLAGRGHIELEETAEAIRLAGGRSSTVSVDLLEPVGPATLVDRIVAENGRLDVLLHAAGSQVRKPALEFTGEEWDRVTDIHLKAAFLLAQATARHLVDRRAGGKIIFVGSLNSHIGIRNVSAYAAAKCGIAGLARVLANEWAVDGICVNTIIPGYYRTALTEDLFADRARHDWVMSRIPMQRLGDPADLAGAAIYFASSASDYVTGAEIRVDGGWLAT
ncbi:2-dehydro-3-deoxy-D-gluconate 5-dehydrogenase [Hyphomicrobiales bacterium]|nr:2-dehydro-3-deoxy-D-gluconate 5-dehydrogenase [Hyphomicrobiales bacterium]CAH1690597.1 2-dehydro-3-deoxy-D-gluconate 5-dehydrogenase [Hyphomicrobiales bacterium]